MSHVISTALLVNAIPVSLRVIFKFPDHGEHGAFWVFLVAGWALTGVSIFLSLLFQAVAPRWARTGLKDWRETTLNVSYPWALAFLGFGVLAFTSALVYAFWHEFRLA